MKSLNIVLSGVGGQGIISLANVLANAVTRSGNNVIVAETHGLSQRGGSVIVHVRLGDVEAPLIPPGAGDFMISLDPLEAARYSKYLKPGSKLLIEENITPPPLPGVEIPSLQQVVEYLKTAGFNPLIVPAVVEASRLGNPLGANMFMLGVTFGQGLLDGFVEQEHIEEAIRNLLRKPEKNIQVFRKGVEWGREH